MACSWPTSAGWRCFAVWANIWTPPRAPPDTSESPLKPSSTPTAARCLSCSGFTAPWIVPDAAPGVHHRRHKEFRRQVIRMNYDKSLTGLEPDLEHVLAHTAGIWE